MKKRVDRIGETTIARNGQKMTVLEYVNASDISVLFEDGTVVKHKVYSKFKVGNIGNPNKNMRKISINEIALSKAFKQYGFRKYDKYDLSELGIQGIYELDLFNPDFNGYKIAIEYDGDTRGHTLERDIRKNNFCEDNDIVLYRIRTNTLPLLTSSRIYIIKNTDYCNDTLQKVVDLICNDLSVLSNKRVCAYIPSLNEVISELSRYTPFQRLGKKRKMSNGLIATIVDYKNENDITVQFENGEIKEHVAYSSFEGGGIGTKQSKCTAKKERCGEESYTIRGERMKIIQYRNADDIDILFDNGYIATHKRYANFKSGRIAKGQVSADV